VVNIIFSAYSVEVLPQYEKIAAYRRSIAGHRRLLSIVEKPPGFKKNNHGGVALCTASWSFTEKTGSVTKTPCFSVVVFFKIK
jgi:hypothetical protein